MSLLFVLAVVAPAIAGTPLGVLAPQALPERGCAAYLFTADGARRFVAMATAEPGALRLVLDGATVDAGRSGQAGAVAYGLAASSDYRAAGLTARLDLTTADRAGLSSGATIPEATLRIDRDGADGVVVPLVGMVGCKT